MWVETDAVNWFQGMSLFYGTQAGSLGGIEYNVYGPTGFAGSPASSAFATDLTAFYGQKVLFEFQATAGDVTFFDDARLWDGKIGGRTDLAGGPFALAFYDLGETGDYLARWKARTVIEYRLASFLSEEPDHGDLFFHYNLFGPFSTGKNIRSDFIDAVPEPASMFLFGLGGIATALINRRRKA